MRVYIVDVQTSGDGWNYVKSFTSKKEAEKHLNHLRKYGSFGHGSIQERDFPINKEGVLMAVDYAGRENEDALAELTIESEDEL